VQPGWLSRYVIGAAMPAMPMPCSDAMRPRERGDVGWAVANG
jgi:hypothetical protein